MEASATVLHLPSRNRLLIKCAEWIGTSGAAHDILNAVVQSKLQSPVNSAAIAEALPPASDRGLSTLVQNQTVSRVAAC